MKKLLSLLVATVLLSACSCEPECHEFAYPVSRWTNACGAGATAEIINNGQAYVCRCPKGKP